MSKNTIPTIALKDFVSNSLTEILDGIVDAQKKAKKINATVIPKRQQYSKEQLRKEGYDRVKEIEFDIAVSAKSGTKTKGGIGVVAAVFSVGANRTSNFTNSTVSRLRFSVPVLLPR